MRRYLESLLAVGAIAVALALIAEPAAAKVPVKEQEYIWVAANVSHPFYAEGTAAWKPAAKSLGVKATFVGPENRTCSSRLL